MSVYAIDLASFSPQNEFLKEIIDRTADETTKDITNEVVPTQEKEAQRKEYIRLTNELGCLKGKGILNTVLGELEGAKTNLDFLNAMKRIEPLITRVRKRLAEAQILLPTRDPFTPLEFTQTTTNRPVGPLQRVTAERNTTANHAAVMFLGRILPLLGRKWDEVQRGAYRTSEGVFREDYDFTGETYGVTQKKVEKTDANLGIWRGVQFEQNSKGRALLKLCSEYQPDDEIGIDVLRDRMYHGEEISDELDKRLNATLFNILGKFEEGSKPFVRVRGGKSIKIAGENEVNAPSEVSDFIPNADFLAQPLTFSTSSEAGTPVSGDVTLDEINHLGLSAKAAKVLTYFIAHPDTITKVSSLLEALQEGAKFGLELETVIKEINEGVADHTQKRLIKAGNMIIFRIPE